MTVAVYSIITLEFSEKREQYIGLCEMSVGIGLMVGPVLGAFLFGHLHYEWTFITISCILLVCTIIVALMLPQRLNQFNEKADAAQDEFDKELTRKVTFRMFFTNKRALLAIISAIFAMIFMLFFDAILSVRLEHMGVADKHIGFFFALIPLFYAITSPFIGLLCRKIKSIYVT